MFRIKCIFFAFCIFLLYLCGTRCCGSSTLSLNPTSLLREMVQRCKAWGNLQGNMQAKMVSVDVITQH